MLKVKSLTAAGKSERQAFESLKLWGRNEQLFRRVLAQRSLSRIAQDFRLLIRADLAMKTGREGKSVLQDLVVSLC